MPEHFKESLKELQQAAAHWLREDCQASLNLDSWESELGYGITGFCSSSLMEKAGVNISFVAGDRLPASASLHRPECAQAPFQVQGLSMIFHPRSPHAPTAHLNVRRFEVMAKQGPIVWFGGGFDFSPYIMAPQVAADIHQQIASFLHPYEPSLYRKWSEQCDAYFHLPHRKEPRGIGGIFFDDYLYQGSDRLSCGFMVAQVEQFYQIYRQLLQQSHGLHITERQRAFQCWRRGRYVEFNLLYDRGTRFGLESGGRTESILISLPPAAHWHYQGQGVFEAEQQEWNKLMSSVSQVKERLKDGLKVFDEIV